MKPEPPAEPGGFYFYPVPQNVLRVSAKMKVLRLTDARTKATDVNPWYGV